MEKQNSGTFVALDFETVTAHSAVNGKLYSHLPLSVGVVQYINRVEVQRFHSLINPETSGDWIRGHQVSGITPEMVAHAPKWPEVWRQIKRYFLADISIPIVAYNCSTEQGVLLDMRNIYELPKDDIRIKDEEINCLFPEEIPSLRWIDPYSMLQQSGEKHLGLGEVCPRRGIKFREHNALEDAWACAQLYFNLMGIKEIVPKPSKNGFARKKKTTNIKTRTEDIVICELPEDVCSAFDGKRVKTTRIKHGSDDEFLIHKILETFGAEVVLSENLRRKDNVDILLANNPNHDDLNVGKFKKAKEWGITVYTLRQLAEVIYNSECFDELKDIYEKIINNQIQ